MKYLLDANACICYLRGKLPSLRAAISKRPASDIVICSVVRAELFAGAYKSRDRDKNIADMEVFLKPFGTLSFDDEDAKIYGRVRASLEHAGQKIGPNDLLIAATALAKQLVLVTHNTSEFSRVEGLQIEDWEAQV